MSDAVSPRRSFLFRGLCFLLSLGRVKFVALGVVALCIQAGTSSTRSAALPSTLSCHREVCWSKET